MCHSTHGRLRSEAPKTTRQANHTSLPSSPVASTSVTKNVTSLHHHIACTLGEWSVTYSTIHKSACTPYAQLLSHTTALTTLHSLALCPHVAANNPSRFQRPICCSPLPYASPLWRGCIDSASTARKCFPPFLGNAQSCPACAVSPPGAPHIQLSSKPYSYCPNPKITFVCIPHPPSSANLLQAQL